MKTLLSQYLATVNMGLIEASNKSQTPYTTIWQHATGRRRVTGEAALRYEKYLGIPKSTLRPDLWPPIEMKEEPAHEHS